MVLNSNLQVPIPESSSYTRFGVDTASPLAKTPEKPQIVQNETFYPVTFIYRLDFSQNLPNVDAIAIIMKLVLLTMKSADFPMEI